MRNTTDRNYEIARLVNRWNEATCPWRLRTDHAHKRYRQLAKAIERKMARLDIREGRDYRVLSNGAKWVNITLRSALGA